MWNGTEGFTAHAYKRFVYLQERRHWVSQYIEPATPSDNKQLPMGEGRGGEGRGGQLQISNLIVADTFYIHITLETISKPKQTFTG